MGKRWPFGQELLANDFQELIGSAGLAFLRSCECPVENLPF